MDSVIWNKETRNKEKQVLLSADYTIIFRLIYPVKNELAICCLGIIKGFSQEKGGLTIFKHLSVSIILYIYLNVSNHTMWALKKIKFRGPYSEGMLNISSQKRRFLLQKITDCVLLVFKALWAFLPPDGCHGSSTDCFSEDRQQAKIDVTP